MNRFNPIRTMKAATLIAPALWLILLTTVAAPVRAADPPEKTPLAWGGNFSGQLGNSTRADSSVPVQVSSDTGLADAVVVSGGYLHSLAVEPSGRVWAWGDNSAGQLGDGTTTDRSTPVQVSGLPGVVAVAAGGFHSLALDSTGKVWAWGDNTHGQLGDGTRISHSTPVQVPTLTGVVAVAAGWYHSLGLDSTGKVWARGRQ